MRALVLAGGDSSRLPGPVPKPFRLLHDRPVIGHILIELETVDEIDQIDVLVRSDHQEWAALAVLSGYECNIVLQPTLGPAARVNEARHGREPLVVILGDTIVANHGYWIRRLIANAGPRARVLADEREAQVMVDRGPHLGLAHEPVADAIDVGSYYIPDGLPLYVAGHERTVLQLLLNPGPLDAVYVRASGPPDQDARTSGIWHDVGTPDGFAAAELAMIGGKL